MKKNAMLKIAAILLVAVLLTTCAISSTFAKYVQTGNANGSSARVAKWGVQVNANFASTAAIFAEEYGSAGAAHVSASADVVAPGTEGAITITGVATGTPEVNGVITITPTVVLTGSWKESGADNAPFYCPVTVNGETLTATSTTLDPIAVPFAAGTDLSGVDFADAITWEWAHVEANNAKDTYLGNLETAPTITINFAVSIEQTVSAGTAA